MAKDFNQEKYGEQIKEYRLQLGLTQSEVAYALDVTPGFISNVENGRSAMSLRILIYFAKIMHTSLDSLVGNLEPEYKNTALDNEIIKEISKLSQDNKEKLLDMLKIFNN